MVTPEDAVRYIKDKIVTLIDNGTLNGTYRQSSSTISFYVNDIKSINRPLITLTLRLSDHHPTMQHNIDNNRTPSTEPNTNISIEFYKPLYDNNGKRVQNRFDNRVKTPDDIIILPFEVSYYEYCPSLLDVHDLDTIYMSILNWIGNINGAYNDPFLGTPKEAKTKTKNANIRTNFNSYITYRNSVIAQRNTEDGWGDTSQAEINWWKTKGLGDSLIRQRTIIENKQYQKTEHKMRQNKVRLTESKLRPIVRETIKQVLKEAAYREPPLFNDNGEVIDTGGWYDEDDYYGTDDPYGYSEIDANQNYASRIVGEIENGKYDNILDKIDHDYFDVELDFGGEWIDQAVFNRKCVIDKDFAFRYGGENGYHRTDPEDAAWKHNHEWRYGRGWNPNRLSQSSNDERLDNPAWKEKERRDSGRRFPYLFKKNGEPRKISDSEFLPRVFKQVYGTDQVDKRPLHRKGSLNRAFDENKIRNIVKESISRIIHQRNH